MFKHMMIAATAAAAVFASPAGAANYISLGRLVCGSEGGQGLIITSQKNLICTYTPAGGGPESRLCRQDREIWPGYRRDRQKRYDLAGSCQDRHKHSGICTCR